MSDTDSVDKQPHYTQFKVQPIEFIRANASVLDPLQANVIKYVCRYKLKGGRRDLEKALDYLRMMVEDWDSRRPAGHYLETAKVHEIAAPLLGPIPPVNPELESLLKHWEDSK